MTPEDIRTSIQIATSVIARFEGCILSPYRCPAGRWSIGYGNTTLTNGSPVTAKTPPVTQQQADELLRQTVQDLTHNILALVTVPLTPGQTAALTSFAYNIGITAFRSSTLLNRLNAGDYQGTANQFLQWNHSKGKVLPGLTHRRQTERAVFLGEKTLPSL